MLNVIRRVSIFVLFIGLMINGIFLVMAGGAGASHSGSGQPLAFHVQLRDKATAEALIVQMKKDNPGVDATTSVSSNKASIDVPTGKFSVAVEVRGDEADSMARMLQKNGFTVTTEKAGDERITLRLKEIFTSKAAATARARKVSEKTNELVQMTVVEAKAKKVATVWLLDVTVPDEASFQILREYVAKKQPTAAIEP